MSSKTDWIAALPVVLLGLRSKPDSNLISPLTATAGLDVLYLTTVAEKTAPITLAFVKILQDNLEQLAFTKDVSQHSTQTTFTSRALDNCKFVWLRVDRVKKHLEAPYTGPHELKKNQKKIYHTIVKKNNDHIIVSIQRRKRCTISFDREKIKPHHVQSPHCTHRSLLLLPTTIQQGNDQMLLQQLQNCMLSL